MLKIKTIIRFIAEGLGIMLIYTPTLVLGILSVVSVNSLFTEGHEEYFAINLWVAAICFPLLVSWIVYYWLINPNLCERLINYFDKLLTKIVAAIINPFIKKNK